MSPRSHPPGRRTSRRILSAIASTALVSSALAVGFASPAAADPGDTEWSSPETISVVADGGEWVPGTGAGGGTTGPQISTSDDGSRSLAAWVRDGRLEASWRYQKPGEDFLSWNLGAEQLADSGLDHFDLDLADDGTIGAVVWKEYDSQEFQNVINVAVVEMTDSSPYATWSDTTRLDITSTPRNLIMDGLAVDVSADGGTIAVAWTTLDIFTNTSVKAVTASVGSGAVATWGTASKVSDTGLFLEDLDIAVDADGEKGVATWTFEESVASDGISQAAVAAVDGSTADWTAVMTVSLPTDDAAHTSLAFGDDTGLFTVAWIADSLGEGLKSRTGQLDDVDVTWGEVTAISPGEPGIPDELRVDASDDGTVIAAAWSRLDGDSDVMVSTATVDADDQSSTWSTPESFNAAATYGYPSDIAVAGNGMSAVVTWVDEEESNGFPPAMIPVLRGATAVIDEGVGTWDNERDLTRQDHQLEVYWASDVELTDNGRDGTLVFSNYETLGQGKIDFRSVTIDVPDPTPPTPSTPSGAKLTRLVRGDKSAKVTVAVADDGGSDVTQYQARCERNGTVRTSSQSTSPRITVSKLTNDGAWKCSGRAKNTAGWSDWSSTRNVSPSGKPAAAPTAPKISSATPLYLSARFQLDKPEKRAGSAIEGYQVRCSVGARYTESPVSTSRTVTVTGLNADSWTCIARARNGVGWSPWSKKSVTVSALIVN